MGSGSTKASSAPAPWPVSDEEIARLKLYVDTLVKENVTWRTYADAVTLENTALRKHGEAVIQENMSLKTYAEALALDNTNLRDRLTERSSFVFPPVDAPMTKDEAVKFLVWASQNHQYYVDHPEQQAPLTGDTEFNLDIIRSYAKVVEIIRACTTELL